MLKFREITVCQALLAVVTNPINSIVPVVCEVYKQKCHKDCSKNIFGVTTLDCVRANTFVGEVLSAKPETIVVPVVGGHSASTIVPLLSQTKPSAEFSTVRNFMMLLNHTHIT